MAKKNHPKEAYYFSHDKNAHSDPKILKLRKEYGWQGYGIFWAIIEHMSDQNDYRLMHEGTESFAYNLIIENDLLERIIKSCIKFELFVSDGECYWSESLNERMKIKAKKLKEKSDAGKQGATARWKNSEKKKNAILSTVNGSAIQQNSKGKQITGNEIKSESKTYQMEEREIQKRKPNELQDGESIYEYRKRMAENQETSDM